MTDLFLVVPELRPDFLNLVNSEDRVFVVVEDRVGYRVVFRKFFPAAYDVIGFVDLWG